MEPNAMELDDLKSAWHALDARLARHDRLQLELLQERRMDRAHRNLRPLLVGMTLQALLGVGLVVLGVACWKQNLDIPGLLAAGIALHAFGVMNVAFAGMVAGLATTADYAAPVLSIQKRLRLLLRLQVINSNAWVRRGGSCGSWSSSVSQACRPCMQAMAHRPGSGSAWRSARWAR